MLNRMKVAAQGTVAGMILLTVGAAGCGHVAESRPVADGGSSHRFVEPEGIAGRAAARSPSEVREPVETIERPRPIEPLVAPIYPAEARGNQKVPVTIGVRLTVAVDGTVSDVGQSLRVLALPGPGAEAFRAAVEDAVRQWRFVPAEWRRMVPRTGGPQGEYWQVTKAEKREAQVDVEFTFTASGEVVPVKR